LVDLSPYIALRPGAACADPRAAFLDALSEHGLKQPRSLVIGRIDRVAGPEDKPGKKSGWYVYHEIPDKDDGQIIGLASFGCWKTGLSVPVWCSKSESHMTEKERANYFAARESLKQAQAQEEIQRNAEAAALAAQICATAADCTSHAYLDRKQVKAASGLKIGQDGRLIVPMFKDGKIVTLEYVFANGDKRRLTGGNPKGAYFKIEGAGSVYVAEGYATAASIHEATGGTVYACFSAANMYEVAATVKGFHPNQKVIICGDDDTHLPGNPGRTKAEQAAQGLGLEVTFPPGLNDFNDFHVASGLAAVRNYLQPKAEAYEKKPANDSVQTRPPGILGDVYDYYNATSGNRQEGFAIQTALAVCSVILARSYKTSLENYPSLYLLNVGKSGTGKEHAKTVVEKILFQCGHGDLIEIGRAHV
jgi:phage/plasmid primase-like uncharacterized protein